MRQFSIGTDTATDAPFLAIDRHFIATNQELRNIARESGPGV
jgi:hypothetical protein